MKERCQSCFAWIFPPLQARHCFMQGIINCISLLERSCKHCAPTRCSRPLLLRSDGEYRNGEQISVCMCIHICYIEYICDIIYAHGCLYPPAKTEGPKKKPTKNDRDCSWFDSFQLHGDLANTLPETNVLPLKIGHHKRKQLYSNDPYLGANG